MTYLLLCFSCTLSAYFTLRTLASPLHIEPNQSIEDFIDKLLRSDKFDQLAGKIAEKAVERIAEMQNGANSTKDDPIYRVLNNVSSSYQPSIKSGEIGYFIGQARSPFSNLSLKYAELIKNRPDDKVVNQRLEPKVNEGKTNTLNVVIQTNRTVDTATNAKGKAFYGFYTKSLSVYDTDERREERAILRNFPSKSKQSVVRTTTNSDDKSSDEDDSSGSNIEDPPLLNTTSMYAFDGDETDLESSEGSDEQAENHKQESAEHAENGVANSSSVKTKRILGRENHRFYVLDSSSEYDAYENQF
ncbi:unnamed protein product, partial [Iphiclides podalirius]